MVPALIDLHVRAAVAEGQTLDLLAFGTAAREQGLDGLVICGHDVAPDLATAAAASEETGVAFFAGVELDTEVGRLLCLPAELDEWFVGAGWRELANGAGPAVYPAAALVAAFGERGGATIVAQPFDRDLDHPCAEGAFAETTGLTGVVVASDPRHAMSNDRALAAARAANLSAVAGSAAAPGAPNFGKVATLFAVPPKTQVLLVQGLLRGRVWPAEIGYKAASSRSEDRARPAREGANGGAPAPNKAAVEARERRPAKRGRKRRGDDEDNRGNRLDLKRLDRPIVSPYDARQPDFDPIARLYGQDIRRANPGSDTHHLSDDELDRINGNRSRGADPNVMSRPDFGELRAERHHISLLLKTIDPHRSDTDGSIALRFALHNLATDGEHEPSSQPQEARQDRGNRGQPGGGRGRRRRGRRRRD